MPDSGLDRPPVRVVIRPDAATLRRVPMFAELPDRSFRRLSAISDLIEVPPGTRLCGEGERPERLHILLEGRVAVFARAHDGRDAVVEMIRPCRHVVLGTVLARLPYGVSARTIATSRLVGLEIDGLLDLLHEDTGLATALLQAQAESFSAMVHQVCDLKLRTSAQRLAAYLLELAEEQPADPREFRLPMGRQMLAACIGCRHEHLSRVFANLRPLGVEAHGRRVVLHDREALRAFSFPASLGTPSPA